MCEPAHRFQILGKHVDARVHHHVHVLEATREIRGQRFDRRVGIAVLYGPYAGRVVRGAAVRQIVPIYGGQHHVCKAHEFDRAGRVSRLLGIQPAARIARVHGAELAGPGTYRPHQHQRGRAVGPALADVGTHGFFADRAQIVLTHGGAHPLIGRPAGQPGAQPGRLAQRISLTACRRCLDAVLDGGESLGGYVFGAGGDHRNATEFRH